MTTRLIANKRISVLLVDDHTMFREGLRSLLKMESDFELVGEAQNGRQAVALVEKLRPAVVVMDIGMPSLNGLEATRQILEATPDAKIIILSSHSDDAYIKGAAESVAPRCHAIRRDGRDVPLGQEGLTGLLIVAERLASKGLRVLTGTIDTCDFPPGFFDVVTAWDVVEHMPNPLGPFEKIRDLLKPGGLLVINTPDSGCLLARMLGKQWHLVVPPEHLNLFHRRSLKIALERVEELRLGTLRTRPMNKPVYEPIQRDD